MHLIFIEQFTIFTFTLKEKKVNSEQKEQNLKEKGYQLF